jgi:hypothetical protein
MLLLKLLQFLILNAQGFVDLMTMKAAKDLSLDVGVASKK